MALPLIAPARASTYNPIKLSMAPCPSSQFVQNPYNPIWSAKPTKLVLIVLSQHSGDPSSGEEGHGCLPFLLAYLILLLLLGMIIIMIYNDIDNPPTPSRSSSCSSWALPGSVLSAPTGQVIKLQLNENLVVVAKFNTFRKIHSFNFSTRLFRHLSPLLRGLGTALCIQAAIRWITSVFILTFLPFSFLLYFVSFICFFYFLSFFCFFSL